jgi:hypothetical protein
VSFLERFPHCYTTRSLQTHTSGTILNCLNPDCALPPYFSRISSILSSHLYYGLASYISSRGFLNRFPVVLLTSNCSASPTRNPETNRCSNFRGEGRIIFSLRNSLSPNVSALFWCLVLPKVCGPLRGLVKMDFENVMGGCGED